MKAQQLATENTIEIDDLVFDHLENIRLSGVTRMENRNLVIALAREWEYDETANWIESIDERIYSKLILDRPTLKDNKLILDIGELETSESNFENISNTNGVRTAA